MDRIPAVLHGHALARWCRSSSPSPWPSLTQAVATRSFIAAMGRLGGAVVLELRTRMFAHFQRLPVAFHERYTSGRVISRQVSDMDSISDLFDEGLDSLVSAVFSLLLVGVGMVLLDWPLALVVLSSGIPLVWLTVWFRRESAVAYRRSRETIAQVIVQFVETFGGISAVQAFRRERRNEEIFGGLNQAYADAALRSSRLLAIYFPGHHAGRQPGHRRGTALRRAARDGRQHAGRGAGHVPALPGAVLRPPAGPVAVLQHVPVGGGCAGEDLRRAGRGARGARAGPPGRASPVARAAGGGGHGGREVRFDAVRFGYRDKPVLDGFDLGIPAGQTLAVVGETGAGKTTMARLLARFYDPGQGSILLDGVDLRQLSDPALRAEIIMITQENFLFTGTIAENIELGKPGASRAEIQAAAAAIGAAPFIEALPDGYDSEVGKRGGRLSAGQRQLVSFARAFIAAPAVLVLDEATSLLDIPSERLVQEALHTILAGRTALIIAHRLSTVQIADRVIVIDRGQIIEDGPPAELLSRGEGQYSALHASWQQSLA